MIIAPYYQLVLARKRVVAECKDILEIVVVFDGGSCTQACWCRSVHHVADIRYKGRRLRSDGGGSRKGEDEEEVVAFLKFF
ncbi:LOW QUALITY PROTEIN: hypothetical protein TorRG33x02_027740 [Trema orientale]|uniref:Uncharacterized protein n=1 Tax=Trema orientale TaxID=63057 RepID=A0A2P5FUN9_TREOI|nr:LOW QUALITY PROTEIN: hypothetical protein TorRG33x02_027740 [Trema orientale]